MGGVIEQARLEIAAFHPDPEKALPAIRALLEMPLPDEFRAELEARLARLTDG